MNTNTLQKHSEMLGQIASHVETFATSSEDTTLKCVLNLLKKYHKLKGKYHKLKGKYHINNSIEIEKYRIKS